MKKSLVSLLLVFLAAASITPASAQQKGPNDWQYNLAIYLWGTGIEGETQVGPVTAPVSIEFSDALDNLSSALMLHFEAQKNRWGLFVDVMHIGLDPSSALPNGATLDIDLTNNVYELGGLYAPAESPNFRFIFGLRFFDLELEGTVPGISSQTIVDENWVDGFVGGRIVAPMGSSEKWWFRARGDIGTGDSDFVWNALLGVDYHFSDRVTGLFGYRWLDYDYDNEKVGLNHFAYDARYEGPLMAIAFNW